MNPATCDLMFNPKLGKKKLIKTRRKPVVDGRHIFELQHVMDVRVLIWIWFKCSCDTPSTESVKSLRAVFLLASRHRLRQGAARRSLLCALKELGCQKHHYQRTHLLSSLWFHKDPDLTVPPPPPWHPVLQQTTPKFKLRIYSNQQAASLDTCRQAWSKVGTLLYQSEGGCQK